MTALAVVSAVGQACAADVSPSIFVAGPASEWTVTIGGEGRILPRFEGDNAYMFLPLPIFGVRRAGTPEQFRSPRDGFGFVLFDNMPFRIGPTFKLRQGRDESDSGHLQGLGDVDWTLEAGAFIEYWPARWLRTRVELRQGFGGHHGQVADITADLVVPVTQQLTLSGGPRATLATTDATAPYFSITPQQSAASGLPVYDATGGLRAVGAGIQARYRFNPEWATHVFLEYERLTGDAGNAPLVTTYGSRDQFQVGIGATYSFDMKGLW